LAAGWFFKPRKLVEQGGLAAAGLADNAAEFPFFDRDIDIIERDDPLLAYGVDLAQLFGVDDRRHVTPSFPVPRSSSGEHLALSYHSLPPKGRVLGAKNRNLQLIMNACPCGPGRYGICPFFLIPTQNAPPDRGARFACLIRFPAP